MNYSAAVGASREDCLGQAVFALSYPAALRYLSRWTGQVGGMFVFAWSHASLPGGRMVLGRCGL